MREILVVDDSKVNRVVLRGAIELYCKESGIKELSIDEAENGEEALKMSREKCYELIFMDIMMPIMDGIESTMHIRQENKKVMIIAVSALDDEENKSKILLAGAEDYIVKPISLEVMKRRLNHYFELIEYRKKRRYNLSAYNLFTSEIYSRRVTFYINSEQNLSEFWDYYLISQNKSSDTLSDIIKVLYGIGAWQLKLKYKFEIVAEESDDATYFTLNNMLLLNQKVIQSVIDKNFKNANYKIKDDKLTVFIDKQDRVQGIVTATSESLSESKSESEDKSAIESVSSERKSEESQALESEEIIDSSSAQSVERVFDFMDDEDLEELESIASEISSLMLLVGSSRLENQEVLTLSAYIEKFGKILGRYQDTYAMYQALTLLSQDINENIDAFVEKSKDISMLCLGFNNDLQTWIRKLFYEGAPSIDFLDSSIISNANMISTFIKPQKEEEEPLDDIFDF